jgi:single-strand DNA-binding protein
VKRTVFELDVEEVAPSLKNATAKVTKSSGNSGQRNGQQRNGQARQQQAQGSGDPWGAAAQQAGQAAGSGWGGDEPPF